MMIGIQQRHFLRVSGIALAGAVGMALLLPVLPADALPLTSHLAQGARSAQNLLSTASANTPTIDGPTFFNLVAVTLVELAAIFWVGAQFWVNFVLSAATEKHKEERELNGQIQRRFERQFSLPALVLLLLANLGVLYSQALAQEGGDWGAALSFQALGVQLGGGRFGTYWLLGTGVILLALIVGLFTLLSKQRPRVIDQALPLLNLFLGALLFIAITMSGDAAAVSPALVPYAVVLDWLHLLAAALWVGGIIYIFLIYLPLLKTRSLSERARSLLALLPHVLPLAIVGVAILAISGLFDASFHLTSTAEFSSTAYGRTLLVKVLLTGALLVVSAYHFGWLLPRLKREYAKYTYVSERLSKVQVNVGGADETSQEPATDTTEATAAGAAGTVTPPAVARAGQHKLLVQQVKLREERLAKKTRLMTRVLNWEPLLAVAIIVCVGLLNVFAGSLPAPTPAQNSQQSKNPTSTVFNGSARTSDGKYEITLKIDPNRFGLNTFTVHVTDVQTGQQLGANQGSVTIFTTMLDMDMGTDTVELTASSAGGFSGSGELSMSGNWGIQVQIRTSDNTLHRATFTIYAQF